MKQVRQDLWSRQCNTSLLVFYFSPLPLSGNETVHGGQFDWGGCLLNRTASVQRSPQSDEEYIGIRQLYCEEDTPSSCESRSK